MNHYRRLTTRVNRPPRLFHEDGGERIASLYACSADTQATCSMHGTTSTDTGTTSSHTKTDSTDTKTTSVDTKTDSTDTEATSRVTSESTSNSIATSAGVENTPEPDYVNAVFQIHTYGDNGQLLSSVDQPCTCCPNRGLKPEAPSDLRADARHSAPFYNHVITEGPFAPVPPENRPTHPPASYVSACLSTGRSISRRPQPDARRYFTVVQARSETARHWRSNCALQDELIREIIHDVDIGADLSTFDLADHPCAPAPKRPRYSEAPVIVCATPTAPPSASDAAVAAIVAAASEEALNSSRDVPVSDRSNLVPRTSVATPVSGPSTSTSGPSTSTSGPSTSTSGPSTSTSGAATSTSTPLSSCYSISNVHKRKSNIPMNSYDEVDGRFSSIKGMTYRPFTTGGMRQAYHSTISSNSSSSDEINSDDGEIYIQENPEEMDLNLSYTISDSERSAGGNISISSSSSSSSSSTSSSSSFHSSVDLFPGGLSTTYTPQSFLRHDSSSDDLSSPERNINAGVNLNQRDDFNWPTNRQPNPNSIQNSSARVPSGITKPSHPSTSGASTPGNLDIITPPSGVTKPNCAQPSGESSSSGISITLPPTVAANSKGVVTSHSLSSNSSHPLITSKGTVNVLDPSGHQMGVIRVQTGKIKSAREGPGGDTPPIVKHSKVHCAVKTSIQHCSTAPTAEKKKKPTPVNTTSSRGLPTSSILAPNAPLPPSPNDHLPPPPNAPLPPPNNPLPPFPNDRIDPPSNDPLPPPPNGLANCMISPPSGHNWNLDGAAILPEDPLPGGRRCLFEDCVYSGREPYFQTRQAPEINEVRFDDVPPRTLETTQHCDCRYEPYYADTGFPPVLYVVTMLEFPIFHE